MSPKLKCNALVLMTDCSSSYDILQEKVVEKYIMVPEYCVAFKQIGYDYSTIYRSISFITTLCVEAEIDKRVPRYTRYVSYLCS